MEDDALFQPQLAVAAPLAQPQAVLQTPATFTALDDLSLKTGLPKPVLVIAAVVVAGLFFEYAS
jgi:hypothetical protein